MVMGWRWLTATFNLWNISIHSFFVFFLFSNVSSLSHNTFNISYEKTNDDEIFCTFLHIPSSVYSAILKGAAAKNILVSQFFFQFTSLFSLNTKKIYLHWCFIEEAFGIKRTAWGSFFLLVIVLRYWLKVAVMHHTWRNYILSLFDHHTFDYVCLLVSCWLHFLIFFFFANPYIIF